MPQLEEKRPSNVDGKNLAGVFSHPEKVFIDIEILDALPDDLKVQGAAEAIKTGFIADMEIASAFEDGISNVDLESVVNKAVAVKVAIVNDDFTEHGTRAFLNYGHTVGHAIEVATPCSHGEAVAIGMVAAGAASSALPWILWCRPPATAACEYWAPRRRRGERQIEPTPVIDSHGQEARLVWTSDGAP